MPGTYAHLMITDCALELFKNDQSIDGKLRGFALAYSHFVHLGSTGPDYPYLDLFQPSQKIWADHMHYRHTGDAIKTMAQGLLDLSSAGMQKQDFIIPFCWTLGYISHVTGDLAVHPVVNNIVGPYEGHEQEHRNCEMIQDAFIYNKIRKGAEIKHNKLIEILQNCSNPGKEDEIHPILGSFWKDILNTHFPKDYEDNPPEIDRWHDEYEEWIGIAGRPLFVGRIFDPSHKFTYKLSTEIMPEERMSFLAKLLFPNGQAGNYEKDVFPKAVDHVTNKWVLLAKGISNNKLDEFLAGITNGDLDTGKDIITSKLIYW